MHRKALRKITQGSFLLVAMLIPVFDIIRFDTYAKELYLFAQVWSFAPQGDFMSGAGGNPVNFLFKGVLPLLAIFLSLPILGAVFGRAFCGWFCPVGTIYESANFFGKKLERLGQCLAGWRYRSGKRCWKDLLYCILTMLAIAAALLLISVFFSGLLIDPAEILLQMTTLKFSPLFIAVSAGMAVLITSVYFARRAFCSYICLFGITMMIPFFVSPLSLRIRFDPERKGLKCKNCGHCDCACIMGIKPRAQKNKVNPKCINCGECITACEYEFGGNIGLLYYGFGRGEKQVKEAADVMRCKKMSA